jgi:hypothetical protein
MRTGSLLLQLAIAASATGGFSGTARADSIRLPPPIDKSFSGTITGLPSGFTLSDGMILFANYIDGVFEQAWAIPVDLTVVDSGFSFNSPIVPLPGFGTNTFMFVAQYTDSACPSGTSECGVFLSIDNNFLTNGTGPMVIAYGSDPGGSTFAFGVTFEQLTGIDEDLFKSQLATAYALGTGASPTYFVGTSTPQISDFVAGDAGSDNSTDEMIDQEMGEGLEVAAAGSVATGGAVSDLTQTGTFSYTEMAGDLASVPEPSSLMLLGGALALAAVIGSGPYRYWLLRMRR